MLKGGRPSRAEGFNRDNDLEQSYVRRHGPTELVAIHASKSGFCPLILAPVHRIPSSYLEIEREVKNKEVMGVRDASQEEKSPARMDKYLLVQS